MNIPAFLFANAPSVLGLDSETSLYTNAYARSVIIDRLKGQ